MEEMYKGWKITVDEKADTFIATKQVDEDEQQTLRSKSLKELKSKIDKFGFKRTPVYYKPYSYGRNPKVIQAGEITSVTENKDRWNSIEIWVTYGEDKSRAKIGLDHLYKQTEKNKKLFNEMERLNKTRAELEEKVEKLMEKLEAPLTRSDIGLPELA
jgi:hypothetical protein